MDNSTNNATISPSDKCSWYQSAGDTAALIAYDVIMPLHFAAGLFGYTMCFIAFYKKAKVDTAFAYQIILTISQTFELFTYAIYVSTFYWFSGAEGHAGAIWFRSSYACMWFTAHFGFPLVNMFISTSLLLTLATAVDRVFALANPFVYKTINHKTHQTVAGVACLAIGISTSVFDCFRFYAELGTDGMYHLAVEVQYAESFTAAALSHSRNTIRICSTLALVFVDAAMVALYRRRVRKVGQMTSGNTTESKRKNEQQKVLLILAVSESTFNFLSMSALSAYYAALFIVPNFYDCYGLFFASITDGSVEIFDVCDFYVAFAVSKNFRQMVFEAIPFLKRWAAATNIHNQSVSLLAMSGSNRP